MKRFYRILGVTALIAATVLVTVSCSGKKDWEKVLDSYEKVVNDYVTVVKKYQADPTDVTVMTEFASMGAKAQELADELEKLESDISGADLAEFTTRYTEIGRAHV
jgi:hypothetical protein